jgi:hypothetical protein
MRPEVETAFGGVDHLGELGEGDGNARQALFEALVGWRRALEPQAAESRERMLDVRVFAASLELARFADTELSLHKRDPDVASPLFHTLLLHLRGHAPSEQVRFETLSRRLKAIGRALAGARSMVSSPGADLIPRAREVVDGAPDLLRAVDEAAQRAKQTGALPISLAADIHDATAIAGAALEEHKQWLDGLSPQPLPPPGVERVDELLRLRGLDLRAGEVLNLARSAAEELRVEHMRTMRRGFKAQAPDAALASARRATPNSLGEAMSWLQELVREVRGFVATAGFVPMPEPDSERVVVDVMPTVLAPCGLPIVSLPPQPLAPIQETVLLVREPPGPVSESLRELSVADLENLVASATYPGLHLQSVWGNKTTSVVRRGAPLGVFGNVAATWGLDMVHGWQHTCEETMRELQFRHSPASRLIMVQRALAHALLAAVDVGLAIGRLQPEAAASLLVRRAGMRLPVARAQVRSMLRAPSYGLSAFVSKVRIEQLRREAHKRWRDTYSDKRFATLLLASGPVPLAYLFEHLNDPPTFISDVPTASYRS